MAAFLSLFGIIMVIVASAYKGDVDPLVRLYFILLGLLLLMGGLGMAVPS